MKLLVHPNPRFLISRALVLSAFLTLYMIPLLQAQKSTILDKWHYSEILGEIRNYRIFLPPSYYKDSLKHYPVIYYYHGWSQRYFGVTRDASFPDEDSLNIRNISEYVATHDVIVVRPDGYDRWPWEKYERRPYNIGEQNTYRQFPAYFPELVEYIDDHYRTIPDRTHRAIAGLSMGGFMSWWIGGKYPHLLCAAGNFCGSTEFKVGSLKFPVEYSHKYMYNNYGGMRVLLHYGTKDFIRSYHEDVNRIWSNVMDNYSFRIYDTIHVSAGLKDMFDQFMETFKNPLPIPDRWNHIDVYPKFEIWGYKISGSRQVPGFTVLENINSKGFRCSVREYLPGGPLMPHVEVIMITPPVYEKGKLYTIHDRDDYFNKLTRRLVRSDDEGRLHIILSGSKHEIGITSGQTGPNITLAGWQLMQRPVAVTLKEQNLKIKLLNKGGKLAHNITARVHTNNPHVTFSVAEAKLGDLSTDEIKEMIIPFRITSGNGTSSSLKISLLISDASGKTWNEDVVIPVWYKIIKTDKFEIADGRRIRVAKAAIDTTTLFLGHGNGDGKADPGESVILLFKDGDMLRRAEAFTTDKYVNPFGISIRHSDSWTKFDWNGATAKYSEILISGDCPSKHELEIYTKYQVPDTTPFHHFIRSQVRIKISGDYDRTPPILQWINVPGDNTIQARIIDGSKIKSVTANLTSVYYPGKVFKVELYDDGKNGDKSAEDMIFSYKIPASGFNTYKTEITATDIHGNTMTERSQKIFVLQ